MKAVDSLPPTTLDLSLHLNSKLVFEEKNGKLYIGGEAIEPALRDVLREQARYLETSQLWEIMTNTAKDQAVEIGLTDSLNWDHVLSAKALRYWNGIFVKMVSALRK